MAARQRLEFVLKDFPRTLVIPETLFPLAEVNFPEGKSVESRATPPAGRRLCLHGVGQARRAAPPHRSEVAVHDIVELRSDTFTLPSPAMREAMAHARSATTSGRRIRPSSAWRPGGARHGKEAGLFVTSGTQGNLVSILAQTRPARRSSSTPTVTSSAPRWAGAASLAASRCEPFRPSAAS